MTIRSATTITLLAAAGMLAACDTDSHNRNSGYYRDRDGYYTRDTYRDQGTYGDSRYGTYPPNEGASDTRSSSDSGQWQYDRSTGRYYDSSGRPYDSSRYNTSRPYDNSSTYQQNRPYYDPNRPSSQPYDSRFNDPNRQYDSRYYDQNGRPYDRQTYDRQNPDRSSMDNRYSDQNRPSDGRYYDQYGRPYNQNNQSSNPNYDPNRSTDQGRFPYDRKFSENDRSYNDPTNPAPYNAGRPTDDPRGMRSNKEPGGAYDAKGSETRVGTDPTTGTGDTKTRMDSTNQNQPRTDNQAVWGDRTSDQRILSIMHAKNQEEIQAGRLAQQQGSSDAVKRYGERLVRDHTDNDNKVMSVARSANITLMDTDETNRTMAREKGEPESKDPLADLKAKSGAEFDRAFAHKMHQGHSDLIRMVESAQNTAKNDSVRDFLKQTLPTLREHEKMANELPQSDE